MKVQDNRGDVTRRLVNAFYETADRERAMTGEVITAAVNAVIATVIMTGMSRRNYTPTLKAHCRFLGRVFELLARTEPEEWKGLVMKIAQEQSKHAQSQGVDLSRYERDFMGEQWPKQ